MKRHYCTDCGTLYDDDESDACCPMCDTPAHAYTPAQARKHARKQACAQAQAVAA